MKKHYRYLLFDLDNTLFDFDRAEKTAFCAAFSAYGLVFDDGIYDAYHQINDALWKKLEQGEMERERLKSLRFEMLLDSLQIPDSDRLSERLSRAYFDLLGKQNFLFPGAVDVCRELHETYRLVIITNGSTQVQKGRYFGSPLEPYFEKIFISELIGSSKPSAAFFDHVMHALGDPPREECCVIGDSLSSDIAGAENAGIDAIWLDRSGKSDAQGRAVTHILRDIRELPAYLASM